MAKNKTNETTNSVTDFINEIADETKRNDCLVLIDLMKTQTGFEPKMWGASIIGFGSYYYKYDSGHEGTSALVGFSPRATAITLYLSAMLHEKEDLLQKLGKHKISKGCIYIKKLSDINTDILQKIIEHHINYIKKTYPNN
jgi:hypothetical protein